MEHISQHLPANLQAQTSLSKVLDKTFSPEPEENEMMSLKYKSKPFGAMSLPDLTKWAKALLAKISVVTGWSNPENEVLNILVDQFSKKLTESYAKVNPDEMEYAFRQAGTTVKDWGKSMNLSLIDEVMIPYLQKRYELSRIEEQKKHKLIENQFEMSDNLLWDTTQLLVKKGNYSVELIPISLYEWMDENFTFPLITREKKYEYLERATLCRHTKLAADFEKNGSDLNVKKALVDFNKARELGYFEGPEAEIIKALAKKMIVFDTMKQAQ